jgi:hypothetical protein
MTQSIAFFSAPGRLWPYSGDAMSSASHITIAARHTCTVSGGAALSRSGLKCGSVRRPSKIVSVRFVGAKRSATRSSSRFAECDWRLPQIARTRTLCDDASVDGIEDEGVAWHQNLLGQCAALYGALSAEGEAVVAEDVEQCALLALGEQRCGKACDRGCGL